MNEQKLVHGAVMFANIAHRGQADKGGEPYILHALAVLKAMQAKGAPYWVQAAAVLHDVVEDGKVTQAELECFFPPEVACIVDILTRRKPEEQYFDYIARIKAAGSWAVQIKLADIAHNMAPDRAVPDSETMNLRYRTALEILNA